MRSILSFTNLINTIKRKEKRNKEEAIESRRFVGHEEDGREIVNAKYSYPHHITFRHKRIIPKKNPRSHFFFTEERETIHTEKLIIHTEREKKKNYVVKKKECINFDLFAFPYRKPLSSFPTSALPKLRPCGEPELPPRLSNRPTHLDLDRKRLSSEGSERDRGVSSPPKSGTPGRKLGFGLARLTLLKMQLEPTTPRL